MMLKLDRKDRSEVRCQHNRQTEREREKKRERRGDISIYEVDIWYICMMTKSMTMIASQGCQLFGGR